MGKSRILVSALALGAVLVTLSGCFYLPGTGGGAGSSPNPSITSGEEAKPGGTPSAADPRIVVLTDDQVVPVPVFTRSTPAGTWPVGSGLPPGFPAGVPVYTDRWVQNNVTEFDSKGRYGYSALFWGGYADVDQLVQKLRELGFEIEDRVDETKRNVVADSDRYRVVISATESAKNPGEDDLLDPAYTITVVVQN